MSTDKLSSPNFYITTLEKYLDHDLKDVRSLSKNSLNLYYESFILFHEFLMEKYSMHTVDISFAFYTLDNVKEFGDWYKATKEVKQITSNLRTNHIKAFCSYVMDYCGLISTQLRDIVWYRLPKATSIDLQYLTIDQVKTVLSMPNPLTRSGHMHILILGLLYETAARASELCNIRLKDVAEVVDEDRTIEVTLHGKGNKIRSVNVSGNVAVMALAQKNHYSKYCLDDTPLIRNHSNHKMTTRGLQLIVSKYGKMAHEVDSTIPQNIHPHTFRHSKAMHIYAETKSLPLLSKFLGHSKETTTLIYGHPTKEDVKKASTTRNQPIVSNIKQTA